MKERANIEEPQKQAVRAQTSGHTGLLQRKCACGGAGASGVTGDCSECERKRLSRKTRHASRAASSRAGHQPHEAEVPPPIVEQVLNSSSGQPLDPDTRALMESRLGHDFGRVRVHTDARAAASAEAVNALAYTVGQQVVFGAGQYQPNTQAGRRLLAHELAHAAQQGGDGGRFQGKLEIGSPDSADEREADRAAEAIEGPAGVGPKLRTGGAPSVLRRKTGDAGSWFRGLFSSLLFGTFWFPDSWLQDYLNKLDETGDIEGDPDSDDKAREIVNTWRKGGSKFVLTARRKALLIHEMLDGPTMGADEDAILELLERSYNYELSYIFGPEGGITAKRLGEDVPDEPGDRLFEFYVRRFAGARTAVLAGDIRPMGAPQVPLGVELPPVGATQWNAVTYKDGTTGWNPECVMGILCQQDSAIIKQLPSLDVKMLDNIEVKKWSFDGESWSYKVAYPSGLNKPDEKLVGVVKRATCNYAAQTMFHEVHHQNQHADVRETVFTMEVDAYTETEKWAIERGLPEELTDIYKSLRTTNEQGLEIPSSKAIEAKVTDIYGGPTPAPDEQKTDGQAESKEGEEAEEVVGQVKGHEEPKTTLVKVPGKDKLVPRPSEEGDTYLEDPPKITPLDPKPVPPEVWKCPKEKPKDEKAVPLQRSAKSPEMPDTVPPIVHEVLNSSGQPLDAATRELMESRFGHDFSRVRVHADTKAAESAKAVNALAYTVKHHVAFDAGRYSPDTRDGQSLLAHELAHVVQQSRGASAPLSLSQNNYLERAADHAASALGRETGPVRVTGASAPTIARQPAGAEAEMKEENIATPGEVKVIPDKGAGKLRVVYIKDGQILAGLAEITPPQGTPLNPSSVQVYAQWSGTEKYPQVRIQTPKDWGSTINLRQDVAVQRGQSEMDEHHVTDMTKDEIEALRQELIKWVMESGGSKFYDLSVTMARNYQLATPAEIKEAGKLSVFQEWKAKRENAVRVMAENAAYQEYMGMEGFSKAEAREAVEYYQGRPLRTDWEKEQHAKGNLPLYEEIRHPRTGVVIAYRERKLRGVGKEFYGLEEYVVDIHGNPLSSQDLAAKAVYGPQDYILDPLGIQDLAGVAEADTELSMISDLATGGVKLAAKGGVKGAKALAKMGRREVAEGLETVARAGEREVAQEGVEAVAKAGEREGAGTVSRTVKSQQVADAVAQQAARAEGESVARGAGRSERAAGGVSQQARAEARGVSSEVKGAESAVAKEGQAQGAAGAAGGEAARSQPTSGRKVVAEHAAEGHEYKVLDDGTVVRCSDRCGPVRNRLAQFEKSYPQAEGLDKLKKEWAEIEALQDANLKSRRAADFDRRLKASFAANRKQAKAAAGAASQAKGARQGVSSAAKASKANAPLPEVTKLPHERGYAGQVEKRYLAESQQEWEKFKAGGKESEVSFARHEQDFNSLSKTMNNKQQELAKAGQSHMLPEVKTDALKMPVDHFVENVASPDLQKAWRDLKAKARANPDLQLQLQKEFGVGSQGAGAREIGARRPDIVEFFLDEGEIVITDITTDVASPVHQFKSQLYREVLENMVGQNGPRVYGLDIDPTKPLSVKVHD